LKVYVNLQGLKVNNGKEFLSGTHRLVIDRKNIFILDKLATRQDHMVFDKIPKQMIFNGMKIECSLVPVKEVSMKTSGRFAYLDADLLEFPLQLRYWSTGDYFYPFGMGKAKNPAKPGKKKLSKYFKDEKFSIPEKENTPVLFSGERLAWLVGHRIDDRFKVTGKTKTVLKLLITS
jgi:tRNA(Ile)-lysidine synthase